MDRQVRRRGERRGERRRWGQREWMLALSAVTVSFWLVVVLVKVVLERY